MELNNILGKIEDFTKELGDKLIYELTSALENNKLTNESKLKLQDKTREIIKSYGEVYQVKNRGVYKYSLDSEYEILQKKMYNKQSDGYYTLDDLGNLKYDEELNNKINEDIKKARLEILKLQQKELDKFRKVGESYKVDELGDDEKYVYLTRLSDKKEMQDFKISSDLYDKIKENNKKGKESILTWDGKEYKLI